MSFKAESSNSKLNTPKDLLNQTNSSQYGRSRLSTARKTILDNEFLNEELDPERIEEYIALLSEFERTSIEDKKFKDAELAAQRIEELRTQEIEYRKVMMEEKAKAEAEDLERVSSEQIDEFNKLWDQLIEEHMEQMRKIESEMIATHDEELRRFDEEVRQLVVPATKYSRDYLHTQDLLEKLIKAKKYSEAQDISKKLDLLERKETEKWAQQFREKFVKKKELLLNRQKTELGVLQEKLKNSLQEKIRMRASEQSKITQKFQNMKKDLELRQNQEISKINLQSEKNKKKNMFKPSPTKMQNQSIISGSRIDSNRPTNLSSNDN